MVPILPYSRGFHRGVNVTVRGWGPGRGPPQTRSREGTLKDVSVRGPAEPRATTKPVRGHVGHAAGPPVYFETILMVKRPDPGRKTRNRTLSELGFAAIPCDVQSLGECDEFSSRDRNVLRMWSRQMLNVCSKVSNEICQSVCVYSFFRSELNAVLKFHASIYSLWQVSRKFGNRIWRIFGAAAV